jgi:hypothetical protein
VSFIGIVLNVVAAQIRVSFYLVVFLLLLALIISIIMEGVGKMGGGIKQVSLNIEQPAGWRQLIVLALVYTLIGVIISFLALLIPLPHGLIEHPLFGGLGDFYVDWYWYDAVAIAAISTLSLIIGLRRRSVTKIILFVLFSATGMTLVIGSIEGDAAPPIITYATASTIALLFGVLTFYRSMIADLLRETWASRPAQHNRQAEITPEVRIAKPLQSMEIMEEATTDNDPPSINSTTNGAD